MRRETSRRWDVRWPGCRSVRDWPACCWKDIGSARRRPWRWPRRCSASAIRSGGARMRRRLPVVPAAADSDSDVYDRVAALEDFEESGRADSPLGRIHRSTAQFVLHVRDQLLRELRQAMRTCEAAPAARNSLSASMTQHPRLQRSRDSPASLLSPSARARRGRAARAVGRVSRSAGAAERARQPLWTHGRRPGRARGRIERRPQCAAVSGGGRRSRRVGGPGPPGLGRRARLAARRSARLADRGRVRRGEPPRDRPPPRLLGRPALGRESGGVARRR